MKPKLFCADCNTQLQWGDKFCPGCGREIEWPGSKSSAPATHRTETSASVRCSKCGAANVPGTVFCETCGAALAHGKEKGKKSESPRDEKKYAAAPVINSWKLVAGFFAFLVVGIAMMQFLSGTNTIPSPPSQAAAQQPAANMQAMPQIEEMEKQVVANPNNHELILRLANLLQDNRFLERAVKYYKDYLSKHPNDANARVDMGICYNDMGNLEEAKKEIGLALKHEPKHLFAHYNLGIVHLRAGEIEKANEWFVKVVALDPKSEVAQRAQQLLTQHNPQNLQPN